MPIPQLNIPKSNALNTIMKFKQLGEYDESSADRKVKAGQRNTIFELEKQKLEHELSPETQNFIKLKEEAELAKVKADVVGKTLDNKQKYAESIQKTLLGIRAKLRTDGGDLFKFKDMVLKNEVLKDHAYMIPDISQFGKPDSSSETGYRLDETAMNNLKSVLLNLSLDAKTIAEGGTAGKQTTVYMPNGRGGYNATEVKLNLKTGDTFDPVAYGLPEGTVTALPKEVKAPKTRTIKKGTETITEEFVGGTWKEIGRGPSFKPTEEKPLTEAQIAAGKRSDTKRLSDISEKFSKIDKNGYSILTDKDAGSTLAEEHNKLAEKGGSKFRYEWKENGVEVDKDGKVAAVQRFFGGDPGTETIPGYAKVKVGAKADKVKTELSDADLAVYREAYPGKSDEEIRAAYSKLSQKE